MLTDGRQPQLKELPADLRALATVTNYDEMIDALRRRMFELGVTNETIDAITGLQSGYVGKLLAPSRIKNLGPLSFGAMLQGLGLKLVVVEDRETTEKMRPRWTQREKALPLQTMVRTNFPKWLFSSRTGRKRRKDYLKTLSKEELSEIGRRRARKRWDKQEAEACA